jgi:hypothetical protein
VTAAPDVLAVLNRRAAIAAARAEAQRAGLDAEAILDSASLYSRLTALDPDAPGFERQVRDLVRETAAARGMNRSAAPAVPQSSNPAPTAAGGPPRQWTVEDVERSTPSETVAAGEAGLLRDLGYVPRRKRR